ncbi:MAG: YbbR-like domain-containing protein [Bacteroidales bacterium]|nr:YbbR-like domain-containing protein [Bacteroidales bacterium]
MNVSVVAHSGLKGRAAASRSAVSVGARCSATGFRLIRLKHQKADVHLDVHEEDLVPAGGDRYIVSAAEMAKYSSELFGEGVELVTFLNQNYTFEFGPENYKVVPVRAVYSASFKPQYMAAGPMSLSPDSVTVYGDDAKLASIDAVLTKTLSFNDISKSAGGVVKLVPVQGLRMSDSDVTWSLEVTRYVELRSEVSIGVRNVPPDVDFSVYPSRTEVVFLCAFPARNDPSAVCEFYVDYEEFLRSESGRCVARADNVPSYVLEWRLGTELFDCMVREDAQ